MILEIISWSWLILIGFVGIMLGIPLRYGKKQFLMESVQKDAEKQEYKDLKTHNQTLAGFTMAALAIIIAFPNLLGNDSSRFATFYFSISLTCFFAGSYLFDYRIKRIFPYLGQIGEYTGVISLGLGFFSFAYSVFPNDLFVLSIYIIFLIILLTIAIVEIYYNKKFFQPYSDATKQ